ncbi:PstS family phosphate ABC transporter substrate-binding protein [Desulfovibrio inopinatus]|uniref:PstS family phosphate ABC transporter substrate-binding protein n=1 Tax=Desulfovibrio inopinatus TaxID=102109 RepID=UPI0004247ED4|nr:PstS family phosphate ABC transporter substrate-binding protein [Desulfovibrio inopinatus]
MKKILALFAAAMLLASTAFAETKIEVKGSTTVLPIMQKLVEAYMKKNPDVKITVSGGGSGNGVKAIIDGTTDLAMSSRHMKDKEVKLAADKGVKANPIIIAIDAIIPIVNPANKVKGATIEQLRDIYMGKITNWKELGGDDESIVVISRDTSSGTYEAWQELVMGKGNRVFPGALLQASSGAVLQAIGKNKKAIGYDGYGYVNETVKGLEVNGVPGNPGTAAAGKYAISRPLFIITNGEPQGTLKGFVDFIMDPATGQKIVAEEGAVPVKK